MTHREALLQITRICYESSDYNRRTQHIHEVAMVALGLTVNQRNERHVKAVMRSENYKDSVRVVGIGAAKRQFVDSVEHESGEKRKSYKSIIEEIV